MSRPPHPTLTDEEAALAESMLDEGKGRRKGFGLRAAAHEINKRRTAGIVERSTIARRSVSPRWLARQLAIRGKTPTVAKPRADSKNDEAWRNDLSLDSRGTEHQQPPPGDRA